MSDFSKYLDSLNCLDFIKSRRSIRRYLDEEVTDQEITTLIDAARFAPSGSNAQPWHFIVVKDKSKISQLALICEKKAKMIEEQVSGKPHAEELMPYLKNFYFFKDAPVLAIFCMKKRENVLLKYFADIEVVKKSFLKLETTDLISVAMAMQNFSLMAHRLEIASCVMTGPLIAEEEIVEYLQIHSTLQIVALAPMGKLLPEDKLKLKSRSAEEIAPKRKEIKRILKIV
ncbi:MAG: nitroreductase family protein [Oligoflexia bacterium]|nr:nitroreductase family protein [Oligoflexia bacterium]